MARVIIRFRGLCAFVGDDPDISKAQSVTAVFVDAAKAIPGIEEHTTALTFSSLNYWSGAASGTVIQSPGDLQTGILPLKGLDLELRTGSITPLNPKDLTKLASLKTLFPDITDDTIKPTSLAPDPSPDPIASRLSLRNGTFTAIAVGNDFPEATVVFDVDSDQIEFAVHPFGNHPDSDSLILRSNGIDIEIGLANLSMKSIDPKAPPDHDQAYRALLQNPPKQSATRKSNGSNDFGGGGGCVPITMTHP